MNYGTAFKGAYDDVKTATERIMPILTQYGLNEREIIVQDPDDPSITKKITRKGYWFHVDGALGASYVPYLKMAFAQGQTMVVPPPDFDFRIPYVCSINTSFHKWPGGPWPAGIYMTKTGLQLLPPSDPDYICSPDTTFSGSRNGLSALNWWTYISTYNFDSQVEKVLHCFSMADYAYAELQKFQQAQDIWLEYNPLTLTIRFKKPNDDITFKYTLAVESILYGDNKEERTYTHICMMGHVTKELIDRLMADLKQPGAWETDEALKKKKKVARNGDDDDDDDDGMALNYGMAIQKKDTGLRNDAITMLEWPHQERRFK